MPKLYKITFIIKKQLDVAHTHALTDKEALDNIRKRFLGARINSWKEVKVKYDKHAKRTNGTSAKVSSPNQV